MQPCAILYPVIPAERVTQARNGGGILRSVPLHVNIVEIEDAEVHLQEGGELRQSQ
jgi:hypothetical protein